MSDYYFEVSIRMTDGQWVVLTISPNGNSESKKVTLAEALKEAAMVFERERLRHG